MNIFKAFLLLVIVVFHVHAKKEQTNINPALVSIIDKSTNLEELCYALQTLERALGFPSAPIFIFHGVPYDEDILHMLRGCTNRYVFFVDVTDFFDVFPYDFTPARGVDYTKQRTEHFVISDMWEVPHLDPYDVILRFSDSTCLTRNNDDLPGFPTTLPEPITNSKIIYQTQAIPNSFVVGHKYVDQLLESTMDFMAANHIRPKNYALWDQLLKYQDGGSMPKFDNSFEIIRKDFMKRRDVRAYHNYIAELKAEQFYNNKWPSEVTRYISMAVFAEPGEAYIMHVSGYIEKNFLKGSLYPDFCRLGPFGSAHSFDPEDFSSVY